MKKTVEELAWTCFTKAQMLIERKVVPETDIFALTDTLVALELEKIEKDEKSDALLDFNDEIIEIVEMGEVETTDITTSGDNLFFCNGILTKNSIGLPATCDLMIALISTDELKEQNQLMIKQLKNRYNDINPEKFTVGIERSKMRLYNIANPTNGLCSASGPVGATPFTSGSLAKKPPINDFKL